MSEKLSSERDLAISRLEFTVDELQKHLKHSASTCDMDKLAFKLGAFWFLDSNGSACWYGCCSKRYMWKWEGYKDKIKQIEPSVLCLCCCEEHESGQGSDKDQTCMKAFRRYSENDQMRKSGAFHGSNDCDKIGRTKSSRSERIAGGHPRPVRSREYVAPNDNLILSCCSSHLLINQ